RLPRPDLTPVWLKGSAATALRAPITTEQQAPGSVNAVVTVGGLHQRPCMKPSKPRELSSTRRAAQSKPSAIRSTCLPRGGRVGRRKSPDARDAYFWPLCRDPL